MQFGFLGAAYISVCACEGAAYAACGSYVCVIFLSRSYGCFLIMLRLFGASQITKVRQLQ